MLHQRDGRRPDISSDYCGEPAGGHDFARQSRGRGLSVGTRDGDDILRQELGCQFDLADYRLAQSTGLHQRRGVNRNPGTDHDEILSAESAFAVSARLDCDAMIEQGWDVFTELILRLRV